MFDMLARQPDDPLLSLIGLFRKDERPGKIDLGVGVYRDETGATPILGAVKAAEKALFETQETKSYIGPEGDAAYLDLLWSLTGGPANGRAVAGVQTPGGSGALRLAADLFSGMGVKRMLLGLAGWPNHASIFKAAGLEIIPYPFFDVPSQTVLFDRMAEALEGAGAGDAVLLHASCHNPSGGVLTSEQWVEIAAIIERRGLLPLVDLAYQGFGRGLEEDVAGLRSLLAAVPEALVAVSSSKSFGLYRERTGAIFAVAATTALADTVRSNLASIARVSYSMPPDHGAAVVRGILESDVLKARWTDELDGMRDRLQTLRRALAAGLKDRWPALAAMADQEGMFSLLPLSENEVLRLRAEHGIYMPTSGRINIAGLKTGDVDAVIAKFVTL